MDDTTVSLVIAVALCVAQCLLLVRQWRIIADLRRENADLDDECDGWVALHADERAEHVKALLKLTEAETKLGIAHD